jgi:hypothetical protein
VHGAGMAQAWHGGKHLQGKDFGKRKKREVSFLARRRTEKEGECVGTTSAFPLSALVSTRRHFELLISCHYVTQLRHTISPFQPVKEIWTAITFLNQIASRPRAPDAG